MKIGSLASRIKEWQPLINDSELEGIGPLLHRHLSAIDSRLPNSVRHQLQSLKIRHRHASGLRFRIFGEISDLLKDEGILCAGLKGIALCELIYPEPGLRPMRDMDVLIRSSDADRARSILNKYGFQFESEHQSRYMRRHHHLPNASLEWDGLRVSLELHTGAISGDAPEKLGMNYLREPLREVQTGALNWHTLGHIDMLLQLSRHALEPGTNIRLISVADILLYVQTFDDEIDWDRLQQTIPWFPPFLSLLHFVTPLPDALSRFKPEPDAKAPEHPGRLISKPGASRPDEGRLETLMRLNSPPEWWMRSYYGVGAKRPVTPLHRARHSWQLVRWIMRRLRAAYLP